MTALLEPVAPPAGRPAPAQRRQGRRAVVVGAGLGGLSVALRLRHQGWDVTVVEKNDHVGGRCDRWSSGGFTFDTGPSILLMRDVLATLLRDTGRHLEDHLDLVRLDPNYRITFHDGSELEVSSNVARMRDQLETFEPGAGDAFLRFLADAGEKYRVSRDHFVERNFLSLREFLAPANLPRFWTSGALRHLGPHVRRHFRDPRLQIAFSFQSMYLGIAPDDAPAVYALLSYTELAEGIWYPRGGLYAIPLLLERLLLEDGAEIRLSTPVTRIEHVGGRATGVRLADDTVIAADLVVCNADLPWAYEHLLDGAARRPYTARRLERLRYGSSAYMLYLGMRSAPARLLHHNVYIGADHRANFDRIFGRPGIPDDPALYVHLPSRTDPTLAPPGDDCVFVLAPCALAGAGLDWDGEDGARMRAGIMGSLRRLGFDDPERDIVVERRVTPDDWQQLYNLRRGATFGIAHDLFQVGALRPANRHAALPNLYFVGAATQPGGGVPMVMLGAGLVAQRVAAEQGVARA